MAYVGTYSCDECGTIKKEENGWYLAEVERVDMVKFVRIRAFSYQTRATIKHYCGIPCLQKGVGKLAVTLEIA